MNNYSQELTAQDVSEALAKAAESKESALKFLEDAGILNIEENFKTKLSTQIKQSK